MDTAKVRHSGPSHASFSALSGLPYFCLVGWRLLLLWGLLWAAPPDTLHLSIPQAEVRFLQQNLLLYAQKLRIEAEKARLIQARLWPNPGLIIDQVDFFAPYSPDYRPLSEVPRFYQITASFSQTLLTAGKRTRSIALQKAAVEIQEAAFADLLRQLRYELNLQLRALQRDQIALQAFVRQETLLSELVRRYEVLARSQIVPEVEYLRLQGLLQTLRAALRERYTAYEETQNKVRQLLNLPITPQIVWIDTAGFWPMMDMPFPSIDSLMAMAPHRPDVRLAAYQLTYDQAHLRLQRAYAYPDLDLIFGYDRLGSYRTNLLGAGVGLSLPLWNRNQGNIRAAEIICQASKVLYENALSKAQSEILSAWRTLTPLRAQWSSTSPALLANYEAAEARYRTNLQNQRVSFVAYIDFFQSYRELVDTLTQLAYAYHAAVEKLRLVTARMPD